MIAPISEASSRGAVAAAPVAGQRARLSGVRRRAERRLGLDPGYLRCGTLLAARDRDEAEALERELAMRTGLGLAVRRLRAERGAAARARARAGAAAGARAVPDDHAIDPRALTRRAGARRCGAPAATLRTGVEVAEVLGRRRRASTAFAWPAGTSAERGAGRGRRRRVVLVDRGIPEDARVPLRPVKGQILRMHDPAGPGLLTRVLRMSAGYVVPARRRALRARRDDGGARLRHDGHRRGGVRAAARRDRAACPGSPSW